MAADGTRKFQKELNSGAIALVLLGLFVRRRQPMYGYEIARHLAGLSGDTLPMNQGAIYPVLRSLERQGLLASLVEPSISGPPRKYYRLTAAGRKAFGEWRRTWESTRAFVDSILETKHDGSISSASSAISH